MVSVDLAQSTLEFWSARSTHADQRTWKSLVDPSKMRTLPNNPSLVCEFTPAAARFSTTSNFNCD